MITRLAKFGFRVAPWAAVAAVAFTLCAMAAYPGGTRFDPSRHGYSLLQNSLSDLGASVAWNGQPNTTSATLFGIGFCLIAMSGTAGLVALIPLYSSSPRTRMMSHVAGALGLVACGGLAATALVAEDRHATSHQLFSGVAAMALVGTLVLFAAATALARDVPRMVPLGWLSLTALLLVWLVAIRNQPRTVGGVTLAIGLQKALALGIVLTIFAQTWLGQRVTASRAPAVERSLKQTGDLGIAHASHALLFDSPAAQFERSADIQDVSLTWQKLCTRCRQTTNRSGFTGMRGAGASRGAEGRRERDGRVIRTLKRGESRARPNIRQTGCLCNHSRLACVRATASVGGVALVALALHAGPLRDERRRVTSHA